MGIDTIVLTNVIAIPCAIMTVVFLFAWRPWSARASNAPNASAIWTAGFGCGLAYMVSHVRLTQMPAFPPTDKSDWLFFTAGVGILLSFVVALRARTPERAAKFSPVLFLMRCVVMGLAVWLLLDSILLYKMGALQAHAIVFGLFIAGALQWEFTAALTRRVESLGVVTALFPAAVATSISLALSDSAKYGFFAGAICSVLGVLLVGSWLQRSLPLAAGLVCVATPVLYLVILAGMVLSDLKATAGALLIAAPLAAWVAELPAVKRMKPWQIWCLRIGCVALVAAGAVAISLANFTPPGSSGEE